MVIFWPLSVVVVMSVIYLALLLVICLVTRLWQMRRTIKRRAACLSVLCVVAGLMLAGCANTSDAPLTIIPENAAIGQLEPDHLEYGELP